MGRIFITGSADGLGYLAAKRLIDHGHRVVLHARNEKRKGELVGKIKGAEEIVVADLADLDATKELAMQLNAAGRFDAVIHNAGVYTAPATTILHVNTLATYILTCLLQRPERLIYLSSAMHLQGTARLNHFKTGTEAITYSDSKLHVLLLGKALARHWPEVYANAVNPGWVPTKMGGKGAPDDLEKGYDTQVWLAESDDEKALVAGKYFFHRTEKPYNPEADDVSLQESFIETCRQVTQVALS